MGSIVELNDRQNISGDIKLSRIYAQFAVLLNELKKKELPQHIIEHINECVEQLNASLLTGNEFSKLVKQKQRAILKQLEKQLKITPINHYQNLWMLLGLSVFGLPIGTALQASTGNSGLLGVGLPFGMLIGYVVGSEMDKKAFREGRQLNVAIKYGGF